MTLLRGVQYHAAGGRVLLPTDLLEQCGTDSEAVVRVVARRVGQPKGDSESEAKAQAAAEEGEGLRQVVEQIASTASE